MAKVSIAKLAPAVLAGAAVTALGMSYQPWWVILTDGNQLPVTGNELTSGLAQALALTLLAGALLPLVLKRRGRRVLALALGFLATVASALPFAFTPSDAFVRARLRTVTLSDHFDLTALGWGWAYAVAAALALAGAIGLMLSGRPAPPPPATPAPEDAQQPDAAAPLGEDAWRDLDEGIDPTTNR